MPIRSIRASRLMAPLVVRGGKNSSEKNLSLDSIRFLTFSAKLSSRQEE